MNTSSGPFKAWERALSLDKMKLFEDSRSEFKSAAQAFFDLARSRVPTARALFEYSTLMDAFVSIQEGRILKSKSLFDESFAAFSKATEVLRATMHFGFLSGYVSGCASLETSLELEASEDSFQGLKNAIALFEQSKITLSFRDEKHPVIRVIDALIKYSISKALLTESQIIMEKNADESKKKMVRSEAIMKDYLKISKEAGIVPDAINYFPIDDFGRALSNAFIVSFPESDGMWLGNLGIYPATILTLADQPVNTVIEPNQSTHLALKPSRGRIRVTYTDLKENKSYDEGCMSII